MCRKICRLFTFIFLLTLVSCIGKLKDADPAVTKNSSMLGNSDPFEGIEKVTPISNDKIEVYWRPASEDPSLITYLIYVNNTDSPIEVKADSLTVTDAGLYRKVIDGLQVGTEYSLKVGTRNADTAQTSKNDKELRATTFSNFTSDFRGISFVSLVEGVGGRTSVKVSWSAKYIGSQNFPRPNDPIQYEIRYMPVEMGDSSLLLDDSNAGVSKQFVPPIIQYPPQLCKDQSAIVSGLAEGKEYYFLVRSIHANSLNFLDNPAYRTEQNGKFLSIKTRESGDLFEFDTEGVKAFAADGEAGLSSVDISWNPAGGDYHHYRLFYTKIGDPGDDQVIVDAVADQLDSDQITLLSADAANYEKIEPGIQTFRIKNLMSYAYYQVKVVACKELACGADKRIESSLLRTRVVPKKAPFNGILDIHNPTNLASSDTITAVFDPPVTSSGYTNKLHVYCFDDIDDTNPDELVYNTPIVSTKPSCNGLTLLSKPPITTNEISTYEQVRVSGITFPSDSTISDKKYCFSVVADIQTPYLPSSGDLGVIKCIIPELPVPTKDSFPGKIKGCTIASGYGLDVKWPTPTAGIYSNYEVYWKEANDKPFRFENAISGDPEYLNSTILQGTNDYSIQSLVPGRTYEVGVLTSITIDGQKKYSEFNTSVDKCTIPAPRVTFGEWVDIYAIGAKVDGRTPKSLGGVDSTLPETLDADGNAVEVELDGTGSPTTSFEDKFGTVRGMFDGVYGAMNADVTAPKLKLSNSGVIKIGWRDLTISGSATEYDTFIETYEASVTTKNLRKYGYKVLRSSNGGRTWVDLTSSDFDFQSLQNSGLLRTSTISERKRNNQPLETYSGVVFTDYSVTPFNSVDTVERARIYYYKIVPYFDGKEIPVTNPEQSTIKVILPPKNMALVNRLMANRSTCLELEKPYVQDIDLYYSCGYNGVGASGLSIPWGYQNTRFDVGGDLIVDRFEMGCNITRGDVNNQRSNFAGTTPSEFMGISEAGSPLRGCYTREYDSRNPISRAFVPSPSGNAPDPGVPYDSTKQIMFGDCFGNGSMLLDNSEVACADTSKVPDTTVFFPGARARVQCDQNVHGLINNYLDPYYVSGHSRPYSEIVMQSEFAAVYYHRTGASSTHQQGLREFRAAGGNSGNEIRLRAGSYNYTSNCAINLPVVDNSSTPEGGGRWKPRWMFLDQLETLTYDNDGDPDTPGVSVNLMNKTISEILTDPYLYDSLTNSSPGSINTDRLSNGMNLATVMTSNNSKLPPLTGVSQDMADDLCGARQVELGWENASGDFEQYSAPVNKKLMNRKEFVLAGAWSKTLDETTVTDLERGAHTDTLLDGQNVNLSCNARTKNLFGTNNIGYGDEYLPTISGEGQFARIFSGSSMYDSMAGASTQNCQSRYGIQDISGNLGEYSSDQIICDFSGETMYLGAGHFTNSVIAPNSGNYHEDNMTPWVLSDEGTGRCSIAEFGSDRNTGTYLAGGYIIPSFFQGVYNNTVIPDIAKNSIDLSAPEALRAGDGYFMDFGQSNFAPPLSANDTMSLKKDYLVDGRSKDGGATNPIKSKFFNPVVGLSMECGIGGCATSIDNMSVSTDYYVSNSGLDPANIVVPDFPINNSQILSDGMSEIRKGTRYSIPSDSEYEITYFDTITDVGTPSAALVPVTSQLQNLIGTFNIGWYGWVLDRSQRLIISNGGDSLSGLSGRYSAHLKSKSYMKHTRNYTGVRCAVKLKVD